MEAGALQALRGCEGDVAEYQKLRLLMLFCTDGWIMQACFHETNVH